MNDTNATEATVPLSNEQHTNSMQYILYMAGAVVGIGTLAFFYNYRTRMAAASKNARQFFLEKEPFPVHKLFETFSREKANRDQSLINYIGKLIDKIEEKEERALSEASYSLASLMMTKWRETIEQIFSELGKDNHQKVEVLLEGLRAEAKEKLSTGPETFQLTPPSYVDALHNLTNFLNEHFPDRKEEDKQVIRGYFQALPTMRNAAEEVGASLAEIEWQPIGGAMQLCRSYIYDSLQTDTAVLRARFELAERMSDAKHIPTFVTTSSSRLANNRLNFRTDANVFINDSYKLSDKRVSARILLPIIFRQLEELCNQWDKLTAGNITRSMNVFYERTSGVMRDLLKAAETMEHLYLEVSPRNRKPFTKTYERLSSQIDIRRTQSQKVIRSAFSSLANAYANVLVSELTGKNDAHSKVDTLLSRFDQFIEDVAKLPPRRDDWELSAKQRFFDSTLTMMIQVKIPEVARRYGKLRLDKIRGLMDESSLDSLSEAIVEIDKISRTKRHLITLFGKDPKVLSFFTGREEDTLSQSNLIKTLVYLNKLSVQLNQNSEILATRFSIESIKNLSADLKIIGDLATNPPRIK